MIKVGDIVTVVPHNKAVTIIKGAEVTPEKTVLHRGYKSAIVVGLLDNGLGGFDVEIEVCGWFDVIPSEFVCGVQS